MKIKLDEADLESLASNYIEAIRREEQARVRKIEILAKLREITPIGDYLAGDYSISCVSEYPLGSSGSSRNRITVKRLERL